MNTIKPYKNKGECLSATGNDLAEISDFIASSLKSSGGKPSQYPDTPQGLEHFRQRSIEFFEHLAAVNEGKEVEQAVFADIELWAAFLGVTRQAIWYYERRGNDWRDTIQMFKNAIAALKKQAGLHYKIPPMVMAFDFCNNHGYVNTSEFKITTEPLTKDEMERKDIDELIKENGLRWNEDTKSFEPREEG